MEKFVVRKKSQIEQEKNRNSNIKLHKGNKAKSKKKNKPKTYITEKEKIEELYIDGTTKFPKNVKGVLKAIKPNMFIDDELKEGWEEELKQKPLISELTWKMCCRLKKKSYEKRDIYANLGYVNKLNIEGILCPHRKFARIIAKIKDLKITEITLSNEEGTCVKFLYRGHLCEARCYGNPLNETCKFFPTDLTVDGVTRNINNLNVDEEIEKIQAKKKVIIIKKKKPTTNVKGE